MALACLLATHLPWPPKEKEQCPRERDKEPNLEGNDDTRAPMGSLACSMSFRANIFELEGK